MKKYFLLISALLLNAVILYAQPNTWTQKADFGGGDRVGTAGFAIGSKGYIGTGWDGQQGLKDFWEYDPATDNWTRKADFPGEARSGAVGFSIGNKGYIGTGNAGYYGPYFNDFWEYDPATNTWTRVADFPGDARYGATGFSIGSKGYFGTGVTTNSGDVFYSDFWEYDPATDQWTRKADYGGGGRNGPESFSIGNKGYIGCGFNWAYGMWTKDFWEYDPATDKWTRKVDFPGVAREAVSEVGFSIGDKGYIGTGYGVGTDEFRDFWEYNPATNTWTRKADFGGVVRGGAVGFSVDGKGYIGTGNNYLTLYKDFWEYTPGENTCNPPTGLAVKKVTDTSAMLCWNSDASVKGYCIVYRPVNSSSWIEKRKPSAANHILLTGLAPNTAYQWKMSSVCKDGQSGWVAGPAFTTAPAFALRSTESSDALMNGSSKGNINISPNPVTGNVLNLRITNSSATSIQVSISDMQGKTFINQKFVLSNGVLNKAIDVAALPKGMYILKIVSNKNEGQQIKFVKAN